MPIKTPPAIPRREWIDVDFLIEKLRDNVHLDVVLCAGEASCSQKRVSEANLHRPGLALSGYYDLFTHQRIQILGNTEMEYLKALDQQQQIDRFSTLLSFDIPVIFITNKNKLPLYLEDIAKEKKIPLLYTDTETTRFMAMLQDFLEDQFALQTMVHGTMVDVYGIGILIVGKSGIGKSEVALDLVERGQRLVADDAVMLTRKGSVLMASATDVNKHFMEIRGLGILDVLSMFGIRAIRYQKRLEVVLELTLWNDQETVERTGLGNEKIKILDLDIPIIRLPMTPGKNITVVAETIAMNHLSKHYGYDPAQAFQHRVKSAISSKTISKDSQQALRRAVDYFEGDIE